MPVYQHEDCDVLAAITSKGFEFARDIAHDEGTDLGIVVLGEKAANPPSVMLLELPPGHVLVRHAHDTYRMEVVVKGSIITPDGRELRPGDVSLSAPGEFYGPLTAGSEGCLTVEVFADLGGLVPRPADDTSAEGIDVLASIQERARPHLER